MSSTIKVNNIQNLAGDDSGIDLSTNDQIILKTANTTAITVNSSQNTTLAGDLSVGDDIALNSDSSQITFGADSEVILAHTHNEGLKLQGSGLNTNFSLLSFDTTDGTIPDLRLGKSSSATVGTFAETANGESIGQIRFTGQDSSNGTRSAGQISVIQSSSSTSSSVPAFMRFDTSGSERMRILDNGNFLIGTTNQSPAESSSETGTRIGNNGATQISVSGQEIMRVNRNTNDGTLINFCQASTSEGHISVSGTTVSYNGGHLSRWSQLADNSRDETIVKGTVMTNLDQMAEWTTDGVTEDNEQLNCMAVSSVEGDANVAGVFVNWDNDDDVYTNDMNVAMTGDMVIRIAQGTTVARGDLLMSAGDGTAKPQDDDIVRSKTIAKVTSTNVSHTYDDGTYLVPCVLMAC